MPDPAGTKYLCLDCQTEFDEPHELCPDCGETMSPKAKVPPGVRYGVFHVLTNCNDCGQPLPLNGPMREVTCQACHSINHYPPDLWKSLLDNLDDEYEEFDWASSRSSTMMTGHGTFEVMYGRQVPHCPKCTKSMPAYGIPVGADETLECEECGERLAVFPAPDWLTGVLPTARQLYAAEREATETPDGAVEADPGDAPRPIAMACPQCGGGLKVTVDSERIIPCGYCEVDVYLPDDLWRRLHPAKKAQRWMVRFEGMTESQREAKEEEEAEVRERRETEREEAEEEERDSREKEMRRKRAEEDWQVRRKTVFRRFVITLVVATLAAAGLIAYYISK